ncbi:putative folate/biopterin transporter [Leptomonas pyrrhocoris]|uniref:MMS19 nucleotide excision repair protein n=1 Tax=Leptomonas pyrrhocoris TaxID=157538 RepID=A0A0N0DSN3_LEPPY|nr:putative folate/biopterin transporter [Leptomonas pyrrhocoris]XP_015654294.1 putative folate/biopterin transporter [Leptomonas pyrrhocoris]KPA75854.1 putative folate/biopterin transporter [Leptomonas pyrrhocoris]KPA75855.1 putative folate/biopterin transporter [Leptomonas pyrrhocoris]|eukprot:XP_015654293.1 putative folate/biopterin transporter [Leptomonas pyrrhocoris]
MASLGIEACISQAMTADGTAPAEVKDELCSYSLLTICTAMKEYLCDVEKVQPAMRLLASTAVDREDLSETDVQLLFAFFSEKLSQLENQTAALSCLALLISNICTRHRCTTAWFNTVALPFIQHVRVQQLPLNCRKQCFCIMTFLFTEATLPACGSDPLGALLELLDGESDPELVLQTFDLHVIIATHATHEAFSPVRDDYFESVSSYFPVVFSQPPNCKVTKADLRNHLKRCLCLAVYSECCVPFMLGKLASPSIAVKEDVIDALLTCFDTYQHGVMAPFYSSLVVHMKNEVVKLSSFSDRASSPTLTKCICMCCEILGRISKVFGAKNQAEALQIFGPVLEGFLSALSADTSISSAYATMVFHVLTGSWNCCIFVAAYLFSMLSMSLSDAELPANAYILFAALVTGMLDALAAFPSDDHVESMRACIERSTPSVAEAVRQCTSKWGLPPSSPSSFSDSLDDFSVVCGCEFVVAVLKLSLRLRPWLTPDVVRDGIDALVWAALFRSTEASAKVCKLLREFAEQDGRGVRDALARLLAATDVPAETGLVLVCELACSCTDALLLAYEEGFLASRCPWMSPIAPAKKAQALQKALDHFGDALQASEAGRMTAILTRSDVPPDYFQCACFVARNLSGAACARLAADDVTMSQLGVAAVLASRVEVPDAGPRWCAALAQLVMLTKSDVAVWRRVGMEGITGAVLHGVAGDVRTTVKTLPSEARLLVDAAALWGGLLAHNSNNDDEGSTSSRHTELVSSFALEYMQGDDVTDGVGVDSVVEAFTYFPFSAQHSTSRPSLLHLLLKTGAGSSWHSSTTFCTAIQCLVESETDEQVRTCLADLLGVLNSLTQSRGAEKGALARALLFSINSKCGGDPSLARSVLFCDSTMRVLLEGVSDAALATRQHSLQLLTSLARGAAAVTGDCAREEKATLDGVRARVLDTVKQALGDHKRKVRQAAGACGHEWYKVR